MASLETTLPIRKGRAIARVPRPRRKDLIAYLFLLPWIGGMVVFTAGPLIASFYLSFTNYDMFRAPDWVGLQNYVQMFTSDRRFMGALRVTLTYVLIGVPLHLMFALLVAMLMNQKVRGLSIFRSIYYLPSLLGGSVAVAVMWRQIFGRDGVANSILDLFGVEGQNWISHPSYALYTLILLHVWQFGSAMVIFLAGLKQIPRDLYEAAEIDGAGPFQSFWNVTLPMLTPVIFFNLVLGVINSFQAFTQAYIVSGGTGGPSDSTLFYTLYLYQEGFTHLRLGYAAAMGWVLLAIIAVLTALNFWASSKWVFYGDR